MPGSQNEPPHSQASWCLMFSRSNAVNHGGNSSCIHCQLRKLRERKESAVIVTVKHKMIFKHDFNIAKDFYLGPKNTWWNLKYNLVKLFCLLKKYTSIIILFWMYKYTPCTELTLCFNFHAAMAQLLSLF